VSKSVKQGGNGQVSKAVQMRSRPDAGNAVFRARRQERAVGLERNWTSAISIERLGKKKLAFQATAVMSLLRCADECLHTTLSVSCTPPSGGTSHIRHVESPELKGCSNRQSRGTL
jgi:hypothetical protein